MISILSFIGTIWILLALFFAYMMYSLGHKTGKETSLEKIWGFIQLFFMALGWPAYFLWLMWHYFRERLK